MSMKPAESTRIVVNVSGSIDFETSAIRHTIEFAAKQSIATDVSKTVCEEVCLTAVLAIRLDPTTDDDRTCHGSRQQVARHRPRRQIGTRNSFWTAMAGQGSRCQGAALHRLHVSERPLRPAPANRPS